MFNVLLLEFISLVANMFNGVDAAMLVALEDKNDALLLNMASLFNVSASSLMRFVFNWFMKFNGFFFLKLNALLLFGTSSLHGSKKNVNQFLFHASLGC
jgi:hypothetical protein